MGLNKCSRCVLGRPFGSVFNRLKFCDSTAELRSCVNVDVAVLGFPPLILTVRTVSVDVKQH